MYVHCCIFCDLLLSQNRERSLKETKKERKKERNLLMDGFETFGPLKVISRDLFK